MSITHKVILQAPILLCSATSQPYLLDVLVQQIVFKFYKIGLTLYLVCLLHREDVSVRNPTPPGLRKFGINENNQTREL